MFAIFFQEINHAGEGGLYAGMVQNRDFETVNFPAGARWAGNLLRTKDNWQERRWFGNSLHGWKLIAEGGAKGSIQLETAKALNTRNPHSVRLDMRQTGKFFDLALYAGTEGPAKFDLSIDLERGGGWKQYRCRLQARHSDANGRLAITANRTGAIWLDVISLFPRDTFRHRPNGLCADNAQTLADLKPAFRRILRRRFYYNETHGSQQRDSFAAVCSPFISIDGNRYNSVSSFF